MINQDARCKLRLPREHGTKERGRGSRVQDERGERITSFVGRELAEGIFKSAVRSGDDLQGISIKSKVLPKDSPVLFFRCRNGGILSRNFYPISIFNISIALNTATVDYERGKQDK